MNSVYEIHMCLLDVCQLAVLAKLFACRDKLPVLLLCPSFT
jgi:hypothetical protein